MSEKRIQEAEQWMRGEADHLDAQRITVEIILHDEMYPDSDPTAWCYVMDDSEVRIPVQAEHCRLIDEVRKCLKEPKRQMVPVGI